MPVTIKPAKTKVNKGWLGLDPSTKTGVVVLNFDGKVEYASEWAISLAKTATFEDRMGRLNQFFAKLNYLLNEYYHLNLRCAIEGYGFANTHTLATLVEIGTTFRKALHNRIIPTVEVPPSSLKKFVTGKGNTKKDQMRLAIYKKWGFEHDSDNIVDAYGLARYVQHLNL